MTKHPILFLAANPHGPYPGGLDLRARRGALDQEASAIRKELKRSGYRDRFELVTRWAAEPHDLLRELRELKPTVVHFSGHGGRDGLFFQASNGDARVVSPAAIAEAFGAAGGSVKLVVLSACYSTEPAEALLAHVACVVGMTGALHDSMARAFAIGFYGALGEQEPIAVAYRQGNAAIGLEGLPDEDRPKLRVRAGTDAARMVLTADESTAYQELPCPYPGMRSYAADDAAHFHGRGAEIGKLIGQLRATRAPAPASAKSMSSAHPAPGSRGARPSRDRRRRAGLRREVGGHRTLAGASPVRIPDAVAGTVTGRARPPLKDGRPPSWSVAWGEDRYGAFAAFVVGSPDKPVQHRMRWIPSGTFLMGSPGTELGRWEDEGPQHRVTLTKGYWLGETPVTQALWMAVMSENPSAFRGGQPDDLKRPVEQVSWDDCQAFLGRLNAQVAGLAARLPTEAEWERACRGETDGATWIGELSGAVVAPELEAIAWYSSNSDGESHPVGRKAANLYGLHDMLGNVYEWCEDAVENLETSYRNAASFATDPVAADRGSYRVYRGGSWYCGARLVRAAYRNAYARGDRNDNLGFRLAGSQESAPR